MPDLLCTIVRQDPYIARREYGLVFTAAVAICLGKIEGSWEELIKDPGTMIQSLNQAKADLGKSSNGELDEFEKEVVKVGAVGCGNFMCPLLLCIWEKGSITAVFCVVRQRLAVPRWGPSRFQH